MTDLRDQIADVICGTNADADAVLALPAIADAVALANLCAPLTVEDVQVALSIAKYALNLDVGFGYRPDAHDQAIIGWEDKR